MFEKISQRRYFWVSLILTLGVLLNSLVAHDQIIGVVIGAAYLLFYSFIAGSLTVAKRGWQLLLGGLLLISFIAVFSALAIYLYRFNDVFFGLLIGLIPALLALPYYHLEIKEKFSLRQMLLDHFDHFLERKESKPNIALVFSYLTVTVFAFSLLLAGRTSQTLQSPFEAVPGLFFPLYFIATALLATYLLKATRTKLPLVLLIIHTFLSTAVALLVYRLGYGFDPFIHQAAENIIATTGTISPKPLYYLGQYGLVTFLTKLVLIDIEIIDRWLVPTLTALVLPLTTFFAFSHWLKKNYALILALAVLIIPFTGFIMTTPQNLANLLLVAAILLSMLYLRGDIKATILYALTAATLAIHPLAGITLAITIFLIVLFKKLYPTYHRRFGTYVLTALIFVILLPLAFIINGSTLRLQLPAISRADVTLLQLLDKFDLGLNLTYFLAFNKIWLIGLVIGLTVIYLIRHKLLKNNAPYLVAGLVISLDFILIKYFLTFPELRDFDKDEFVRRISWLALYILLPLVLTGFYLIIKRFWQRDHATQLFIVLVLAGLITGSLYLSYPQVDQYQPAKFFSLSESDLKTVRLIEQTANPEHVVLANQMIGVAAIKEFGFKKYYGNQFYYSMPNGNPRTLYDLYLAMIYDGALKSTMFKAMDIAEVDEAYFVLNRYWSNFEKIAGQARQSADAVLTIDDGNVYIFKYQRAGATF